MIRAHAPFRRSARALACAVVAAVASTAALAATDSEDAGDRLRAAYARMRDTMEASPFGRPVVLESSESGERLSGDIHALIDFPFPRVRDALRSPQTWCEILILHPNIERCEAGDGPAATIAVDVGRARLPVAFSHRVAAADDAGLRLDLAAAKGPLGTTDYRIELEAAPLERGRTILHVRFSHAYGTRARLAMQAYLATLGREKVGFTVIGRDADGRPRYVGHFRGALERNAMRHYLAIEAFLDSLRAPARDAREQRLRSFFASTRRYPRQLHEDVDYLDRKRAQLAREPSVS